jgi:hypothetical protein
MQKKLLVTGCHRSGTTLLAAIIGMHNDIALINEDYYDSYSRILCKKYIGTKAVIPTILLNKKRSKIYISIYRKFSKYINIVKKSHVIGGCNYSIIDFDKVIFIHRDKESNISSIIKRHCNKRKFAERDIAITNAIKLQLMNNENVLFIELKELTSNTEYEAKKICNFLELNYDKKILDGYKYTPTYKNNKIENKN